MLTEQYVAEIARRAGISLYNDIVTCGTLQELMAMLRIDRENRTQNEQTNTPNTGK
jgi:uncharacterized membrane protein